MSEIEFANKKISDFSKEELLTELKNKGFFGLVYKDYPQGMIKNPTLIEDISRRISNGSDNTIIEGDNIDALNILTKTHSGKIDVIYIDPPYNTQNSSFTYNDKTGPSVIKGDDGFRHSAWLSMMKDRLLLAKRLLKDSGVIYVSIDEFEFGNLKFILDSVFSSQNFIANIIWDKRNPKGNTKTITKVTEYVFCYAKNKESILSMDIKKPNAELMINEAKRLFEIYGKEIAQKEFKKFIKENFFKKGEAQYSLIDENGDLYRSGPLDSPGKGGLKYDLIHPVTLRKCKCPTSGWRLTLPEMEKIINSGEVIFGKDETTIPCRKMKLKDYILETMTDLFSSASNGIDQIISLGFSKEIFSNPKPTDLLKFLLSPFTKNITILDFFAGSGTTGQAVLELNKEDGGDRKFILCSNNEGKVSNGKKETFIPDAGDKGICRSVTYERIKRCMLGLTGGKKDFIPFGGNLSYFKIKEGDANSSFISAMNFKNKTGKVVMENNTFSIHSGNINGKDVYSAFLFGSFSKWKDFISAISKLPQKANKTIYLPVIGPAGEIEDIKSVTEKFSIELINK